MYRLKTLLLAGFILAVSAGVYWLFSDEPLNEDAVEMFDAIQWQSPSSSYEFHLGILAPLGTTPEIQGKKALAELRRFETAYPALENFETHKFVSELPVMEVPPMPFLSCRMQSPMCVIQILETDFKIEEHAWAKTLLSRYLKFLNFDIFNTASEPHQLEPFANFSALQSGNKLALVAAIQQSKNGKPKKAAEHLYRLIQLQRTYLRKTDSLLAKMVAYSMLSETLDVLSIINRTFKTPHLTIENLSNEELSFDLVMAREFALVSTVHTSLRNTTAIKKWPAWALKIAYKPQLTINATTGFFTHARKLSKGSADDFAAWLASGQQVKIEKSWIRNFIGTHMANEAPYKVDDYVARGFDLNAKINLFNALENKRPSNSRIQLARNPYSQYGYATYDKEQMLACFDGPLVDKRNFRCLWLITMIKEPINHSK